MKKNGFTLIEVMIVLAILGAISVLGLSKFNRQENLKSSLRKITTAVREIKQRSKLQQSTFRLVISMNDKEGHSWWIEKSNKNITLDPHADKKSSFSNDEKKTEGQSADGFEVAKDLLKKPQSLPKGWYFTEVETMGKEGQTTSGLAYIHFFPQGVAEEALLQVSNKEKGIWTLHIPSLTSQVEIYQEKKRLKDFQ